MACQYTAGFFGLALLDELGVSVESAATDPQEKEKGVHHDS
jgi:hypothetical protein